MGAAIQRGHEHGSRRIAIVGVITRQLRVKSLKAEKDLVCALVVCKVWKLAIDRAIIKCSHESCAEVVNKSNIQSKTPPRVTLSHDNIYKGRYNSNYSITLY
jgi:hypothetical protein